MARSAEGVEKIFMNNVMAQPCGGMSNEVKKASFVVLYLHANTPSPLRGTSPTLGEEFYC